MDLIIQGVEIETSDLRELAKLSGASQIKRINGNAFRLIDASQQDCMSAFCLEAELDFAFVLKTAFSFLQAAGLLKWIFHDQYEQ